MRPGQSWLPSFGAKRVAVLFAASDSVYKRFEQADVYDLARDARTFQGGCPVIAHPPCAQWSVMRAFAKDDAEQKSLSWFGLSQVRAFGGVLEHPWRSSFWPAAELSMGRERDVWGGWTLPIEQRDFGHGCRKRTWLYIVGVEPACIPRLPLKLGKAAFVCASSVPGRVELPGKGRAREATPVELARWLLDLAGGVGLGTCSVSTTASNSCKQESRK